MNEFLINNLSEMNVGDHVGREAYTAPKVTISPMPKPDMHTGIGVDGGCFTSSLS